jgi:hypothetical protein
MASVATTAPPGPPTTVLQDGQEDVAAADEQRSQAREVGRELGERGARVGRCRQEQRAARRHHQDGERARPPHHEVGDAGPDEYLELRHTGGGKDCHGCGEGAERDRRNGAARKREERLQHDDDHDRLDRGEHPADQRQITGAHVEGREGEHEGSGRDDERQASDDEARPAGAAPSHVHREFGGGRPGNEAGNPEQIEEFLAGDPTAALDAFALDERDVSGGSAEGR